jgi:LemA protein
MTTFLIVLAIVALIGLVGISIYNNLQKLNVNVHEGFAQIEVQLQRRADLIPNLVETVKGYAAHESATFEKVVQARAQATSAQGVHDVAQADGQLTQALRGLLMVSEAYPDLKASENFRALQEELSSTENKIGFARQYYNDNVRRLNQAIVTFPSNLFVGMAKVAKAEFYEVTDPGKRDVPNVSFS